MGTLQTLKTAKSSILSLLELFAKKNQSSERKKYNLTCIYYTIIDFNELDIRIYLPEKVNIPTKGR